jgi:hypothetical protein
MKTLLLTLALGILLCIALPRDRGSASTAVSKNSGQELAKAETNSSRPSNRFQKSRTDFSSRMALHRPRSRFGLLHTPEFSDDVRQAWVSHYASKLVPGSDWATAIAVDASGNVYVTGNITNPPFGLDYLTVNMILLTGRSGKSVMTVKTVSMTWLSRSNWMHWAMST